MKIIIGAMKEELVSFILTLELTRKYDSLFEEYYSEEHNLVVAISGIGMVNASSCLTYLLTKYQDEEIKFVLNIGTACSISKKSKQNDVLLVNQAFYSTVDVTPAGYQYGQIPKMPSYFQTNFVLDEKIFKENNFGLANIATADIFFEKEAQVEQYVRKLPKEISLVDMECSALFQVCTLFKIKTFGAIKIVSDVLGKQDSTNQQFDEFLSKASEEIKEILLMII